jgi:hypothetical protein
MHHPALPARHDFDAKRRSMADRTPVPGQVDQLTGVIVRRAVLEDASARSSSALFIPDRPVIRRVSTTLEF